MSALSDAGSGGGRKALTQTTRDRLLAILGSEEKAALVDALLRGDHARTWSIFVSWGEASGCRDARTVLAAFVRHVMRLVGERDAPGVDLSEASELLEQQDLDFLEQLAREIAIVAYAPRQSPSVN